MRHVLAGELAQHLAHQAEVDDRARPAGQIDHGARQRLVERGMGRAEAGDAATLAERPVERLAERQRAVLDRVVVVDLEVALAGGADRSGHAWQGGQHVVEKADAGLDLGAAGAVEVERHRDGGLAGLAADLGAPRAGAHPTVLMARSGRAR